MSKLEADEIIALFRINEIEGIGNLKLRNILLKCGKPTEVFELSHEYLLSIDGISKAIAKRISEEKKKKEYLSAAELKYENTIKAGINITTIVDDDYPFSLKNIYDPPLILFFKGKIISNEENCFGFVGTRIPTQYGRSVTEKLIRELSEFGVTIISGFARGIDTCSHTSAIKSGLKTAAVLGCGLNHIYPPENRALFFEIAEKGCLISEYPVGTKPNAINFPKRNRIITGLSLGVVIVESALDGGAMLTAKYAVDQDREVFAVPGNLGIKQSLGPNHLIKKNSASLISSAEDIISVYGGRFKLGKTKESKPAPIQLSLLEEGVFNMLSREPVHIDTISENLNLSISECLYNLLQLEFKGLIRQLPGKFFIKDFF